MVRASLALAMLAACSGKPRPDDSLPTHHDGGSAMGAGSAAPAAGSASAAPKRPATGVGDLQIRVEWRDVPVVARTSPGRTPCGTPRAPSVAPTTTWGVPEALVVVEGAPAAPPAPARVTLRDCALAPRIVVGESLALTSAADRPASVVLRKHGELAKLASGAKGEGEAVPVQLPIAGHTITAALDADSIYSLETGAAAADIELAYIIPLRGAYVTEANGQVTVHDLPVGSHAVTAWLPPRAGQPARVARGTATITDGDLAEVALTLAP